MKKTPDISLKRLLLYRKCLIGMENDGIALTSSRKMGDLLSVNPDTVRKDISLLCGCQGRKGIGYDVRTLRESVEKYLGMNEPKNIIICGVGNIGQALLNYQQWASRGFRITAAFDRDKRKTARAINGIPVMEDEQMADYLRDNKIDIAVVSVSSESTKEKIMELYAFGIKSFYVISSRVIEAPADAQIEYLDMVAPLEILIHKKRT